MNNFVKGYADDAAMDIVLDDVLLIKPGLNVLPLPCTYTPEEGEVAFVIPRGSTASKGILTMMVAIDPGYKGTINVFAYNTDDHQHVFAAGERAFSIVNLKQGFQRAIPKIAKEGARGDNWKGSSGK